MNKTFITRYVLKCQHLMILLGTVPTLSIILVYRRADSRSADHFGLSDVSLRLVLAVTGRCPYLPWWQLAQWPDALWVCFFFIVLGDGFSPSVSNGLVLKRKKGLISKSQVLFALWLFTMTDHTGKQICVFYWLTCSHCNAASNLLMELSSLSCNVN